MSDAEVMTTAIVAMLNFGGNYAQARKWLKRPQYMILLPMVMTTDYVTKGSESDTYIYNHKKVTKDVAYSTIVSPRNQ
jgi:hypothetical protein